MVENTIVPTWRRKIPKQDGIIFFLRFYSFWERQPVSSECKQGWRVGEGAEAAGERESWNRLPTECRDLWEWRGLIPGPWDEDLSQRQTPKPLSHPGAGSIQFLIMARVLMSGLLSSGPTSGSTRGVEPIKKKKKEQSIWILHVECT